MFRASTNLAAVLCVEVVGHFGMFACEWKLNQGREGLLPALPNAFDHVYFIMYVFFSTRSTHISWRGTPTSSRSCCRDGSDTRIEPSLATRRWPWDSSTWLRYHTVPLTHTLVSMKNIQHKLQWGQCLLSLPLSNPRAYPWQAQEGGGVNECCNLKCVHSISLFLL